ncbi:hypothetical protein ICE98_02997 [Lactococcus lactis]|nr:hypothetical protein [Lactococcus lactis]
MVLLNTHTERASMQDTKTHRERAKLTQKNAEMIGVTPNTINNWEKDSSNLKDFIRKNLWKSIKLLMMIFF